MVEMVRLEKEFPVRKGSFFLFVIMGHNCMKKFGGTTSCPFCCPHAHKLVSTRRASEDKRTSHSQVLEPGAGVVKQA